MGGYDSGYGSYGSTSPAWDRTNIQQSPGSTPENPTARPDFQGQGFFNNMAFRQSPFGGGNPYGSLFQTPQYGGQFAPFGSTTGEAFSRRGNNSLFQPTYGGDPNNPQGLGGAVGSNPFGMGGSGAAGVQSPPPQQTGYGRAFSGQPVAPQFQQAMQFGNGPVQPQGGYGNMGNPFLRFGNQGIGGMYGGGWGRGY